MSKNEVAGSSGKKWVEKNGVLLLDLPLTTGMAGDQWLKQFETNEIRVGGWGKELVGSIVLPSTESSQRIVLLNWEYCCEFFRDWVTFCIWEFAQSHGLQLMTLEACVTLRSFLSDADLVTADIRELVMLLREQRAPWQEQILDRNADGFLLSSSDEDQKEKFWTLEAFVAHPSNMWGSKDVFAFIDPTKTFAP